MCFRTRGMGGVEVVLPGEVIWLRRLWVGGNYEFFLAKPIFKIRSLNLFSTEHPFRYHEI